jgi:Fe-S-cluster containining protein
MEKGTYSEGKPFHPGAEFFGRMETLYARMSRAYAEAASRYGFGCTGCKDNCCTQRFHHHTLAEFFYLLEGLRKADRALALEVLRRAGEAAGAYREEALEGRIMPIMCPANFDGLCSLYGHRPMICRLHGLPHLFRRPDGLTAEGGGCHRFVLLHRATERLDRTEFYTELASIEKGLRVRMGFAGRYSKSTAQMLLDMAEYLDKEGL